MEKLKLIKCWKTLLLLIGMSMLSGQIFAQSPTITGKVVDDKGLALIGATVKLKGAAGATTTDVHGNFSIQLPANVNVITVSYLGYFTQDLAVKPTSKDIRIVLAANQNDLNEVVVVGYGTQKRADVTGTIVTVDSKTLKEVPASNVIDQLKGRVAGLDVVSGNNGPIITLRGNRTIGALPGVADGPLIVLDGEPYYNSMENINPNDIKNVEVLKGASATAIYGSRASGGVILITSNRGHVGDIVTSFDTYQGIGKLEGKVNMLNGKQFAQLQNDAVQGAQLQSGQTATSSLYALSGNETKALNAGVSTNYADLLLQNSVISDQNLRVSGGTEKSQFSVGAGYQYNSGVEPNNTTKRTTLNANYDVKLSKYIKFGLSTQTTVRLINAGGGNQYQNALYMSPLTYPYNPDGSLNLLPQSDELDSQTVNPLLPGRSPNQYYNYTRGFVNNNIGYLEISPVSHLKYRYTLNYNFSQSLQGQYRGINNADLISIAKTSASTINNYQYRLAQEHLLTYDNVFANKHNLNVIAGFTNELQHGENSEMDATGIPEDANRNTNLFLAQSVTAANLGNGGFNEQSILSLFARVNYSFDRRYDLTLGVRNDANSALASGHQHTEYPEVGLGWVLSNESFMKQYSFIDNLKLRAGYGITSTTGSIQFYNTLGQLSSSKYQYGGSSAGDASGVRVTQLVNTNLSWQRTAEYNFALDFAVLKNRLTGSVEVYSAKTTGIILPNQLPSTTGATTQVSNLGSSANKGLEITLSSVNIQNQGGFGWSTDFNIAFSREHIVALPNGAPNNINAGEFVGQPLSVIYDVKKIGIWQTSEAAQAAVYGQKPGSIKIQDLNNDGKIDAKDDQIIGNFQPQYIFGLNNRFTYKNFDFSFFIQGRMKFTTVVPYVSSSNSSTNGWQFLNLGRHNQPVLNYWTPTNASNAFPEPNYFTQLPNYSTLQYYDGSFIRVKSINLGYNLPSEWAKAVGMLSLRIYANVTNPFFLYAPIRSHGFSVPDAESTYNILPAAVSNSGNIGGADPGSGTNFRGVGLSLSEQTTNYLIGVNARF
ncbi:MAG TPA: SusC/RagA family TonB-linked outer membrane protein [Mucilaginibacter sp.]|jgi:TonB-linked SusC/RagA family outer membrane protein